MTFNPDSYEEVKTGLITKGEYLVKITEILRDAFATGTEYIKFTFEIVSNYDGDQDNHNEIGKTFKTIHFLTEKTLRYYAQWCRDLGIGKHDNDNDYDVGNGPGLRDVYLSRFIVGTVSGKLNDGGYPDYKIWSPRAATSEEYAAYGDKSVPLEPMTNNDIPF